MPVLRYVVGGGESAPPTASTATIAGALSLRFPTEDHVLPRDHPVDFIWTETPQAAFYRLEVEGVTGTPILSAVLSSGQTGYRAPSWLKERAGDGNLRWRVLAIGQAGSPTAETAWRGLRLAPANSR